MSEIDPAQWDRRSSGAFQDFVKFQAVVRECVGVGDLPRVGDQAAVTTAIRRAGAEPVVDALPSALDTQLGRVFDGEQLSQGQWQKLAVARGFMRPDPLLLVLDEPTAALDPQAEHDLFENFAARARSAADNGAITILVSHRFSTVHMADHIVVLDGGAVREQGTHAELMAAHGAYSELFTIQAEAYRT